MTDLLCYRCCLILTVLVHIGTIAATPTFIMNVVALKMRKAGLPPNTIYHAPPITEKSRNVVRPSPDLIYSTIGYDVSENAIQITAPIP